MGSVAAAALVVQTAAAAASSSTLVPMMRSASAVHPSAATGSSSQAPLLGFRGMPSAAVVQPSVTGSTLQEPLLVFRGTPNALFPGEVVDASFFHEVTGTYPLPPTATATAGVSRDAADNQYEQHRSVGLSLVMIQQLLANLQASFQQKIAAFGPTLDASTNLNQSAVNSGIQSDLPMYQRI